MILRRRTSYSVHKTGGSHPLHITPHTTLRTSNACKHHPEYQEWVSYSVHALGIVMIRVAWCSYWPKTILRVLRTYLLGTTTYRSTSHTPEYRATPGMYPQTPPSFFFAHRSGRAALEQAPQVGNVDVSIPRVAHLPRGDLPAVTAVGHLEDEHIFFATDKVQQ